MDKELKMKIIDKVDNKIIKPPIVSTQLPLSFNQLDFRRFECLVLAVAVQKYELQDPKHIGCGGSDRGRDIQGFIIKEERKILVAIQAKRYKDISACHLIKALKKIYKNFPKFKGEFWIITSASVSDKAREQFAKEVNKKKIGYKVIDGSTLEADLRSIPDLLKTYFSTPISFKEKSFFQAAENSLKQLQILKDDFLEELDRSFAGNDEFVTKQMQKLYRIVKEGIRNLKSEMVILSKVPDVLEFEKCMNVLIGYYRWGNQVISGSGKPFFGKDAAIKAFSEKEEKIENFISKYEVLREGLKKYLDS
ncbi:MAG: hypothetical protein K1060chlam1_01529 [Candidatus Anoxychlamydiales bacterium]|nr:hypothetical protein [Candidatus Anoxychlamydiales bacterium]